MFKKDMIFCEKIKGKKMEQKKIHYKRRIAVIAVCLAGFAAVMFLITTNRISPFDDTIRYFFYRLRNPALSALLIPITYLGNWQTLTGISLALILFPKTRRKFGLPAGISALFSDFVNRFVKVRVMRARPDSMLHIIEQGGYSFPSGHAMTSLVFYGMLIYWLRQKILHSSMRPLRVAEGSSLSNTVKKEFLESIEEKRARRCGTAVTVAGILLILLIGLSRIYVGVHYPSDVLAGWFLGGALFTLFLTLQQYFEGQ